MTDRGWSAARAAAGALVLGVVLWQVGIEPVVAGVRAVGPGALAVALVVVGGIALASAQRWRLVAAGIGVRLSFSEAVAAYYRSLFLNSVLPGGVLGDVHRGWAHRTLRSVFWERVIGQAVQVVAGLLVVLVLWPADRGPSTTVLALAAAVGGVVTVGLLTYLVARGVLRVETLTAVVGLSLLATTGNTILFLVAARAAGVETSLSVLVPIALVVLVAASLPLNIAGWGPREGAAAWIFAAAGLGAATGTTVAVTFGVLSLAATLPGAVLLLVKPGSRRAAAAPRVREEATVRG